MKLFRSGSFQLHSGETSDFKIDCDAISAAELKTLANQLAKVLPPFGAVIGIPKGGLALAKAMKPHITQGKLLIVDDVLTTGMSMERVRAGHSVYSTIGAVLFARGYCPDWITPLFQMPLRRI